MKRRSNKRNRTNLISQKGIPVKESFSNQQTGTIFPDAYIKLSSPSGTRRYLREKADSLDIYIRITPAVDISKSIYFMS